VAKHPPIEFDHNFKGVMSLRDAMDGEYQGLLGRDDPMFLGFGSSISLRIQVRMFVNTLKVVLIVSTSFLCLKIKGYEPWHQKIYTMDWCSPPRPITRAKLSTNIARHVKKFIQVCSLFSDKMATNIFLLGQPRRQYES
jgi:hypothetical protein